MKKILLTLALLGSVLFGGDFEDAEKAKKVGDSYKEISYSINDIAEFRKGEEYHKKAVKDKT